MDGRGVCQSIFLLHGANVYVYMVFWKEGLGFSTHEDEVAVVVTGVVSRWHKVQVRW